MEVGRVQRQSILEVVFYRGFCIVHSQFVSFNTFCNSAVINVVLNHVQYRYVFFMNTDLFNDFIYNRCMLFSFLDFPLW